MKNSNFRSPFTSKRVPFGSPFCQKLGPLWVPFLQFLGPLVIEEQCIPHPPHLAPCCLSIDSLPWPEPMQKLHFSSLIFSPSSCRSVSSLDFNSFLGYAQINLNSSLLYSENLVLPVFFILQPSCWVGLGGTMAQWCITPCSEVYSLAPTFSRSSNSETSTRVWRVEPTHALPWQKNQNLKIVWPN